MCCWVAVYVSPEKTWWTKVMKLLLLQAAEERTGQGCGPPHTAGLLLLLLQSWSWTPVKAFTGVQAPELQRRHLRCTYT